MPELFPTSAAGTAVVEDAEEIVVDLDAEIVAENPDADVNETLPIPPAGNYICRAALADTGEKENPRPGQTKGQERKPFVTAGIKLTIVDEGNEFHNFELTDYLNSLVMQRRGTSALHHFMNCIGETLPTHISIRDLMTRVSSALESGPLVNVELEWKASRKSGPGKYDYEDVARKMRDFPKNPEGDGRSQIFVYKDPKTGQTTECRAFVYVSKYLLQQ